MIVQGLIFIAVQSRSLQSTIVSGCREIAELIWPSSYNTSRTTCPYDLVDVFAGIWLVAYAMLVFGLETTFRSLRRTRFRPRGKWDMPICLSIVALLILATFLISLLLPSRGHCSGSLIGWTSHYAEIGFMLGCSLVFLFLLSAVIIVVQLRRTSELDREERAAAMQIVCYLVLTTIIVVRLHQSYSGVLR